jgi:hypothetical protein
MQKGREAFLSTALKTKKAVGLSSTHGFLRSVCNYLNAPQADRCQSNNNKKLKSCL